MHAWIYQISDSPIEEFINEDTLNQGDGTDYDYCAEISVEERKEAVKTLLENILPLDMFKQVDDKAFDYVGGIEEWKRQWVQRIQQKAATINNENVMDSVGATYKLEQEIQNPLDTDAHFYLCGDSCQSFAEKSAELMRWIDTLQVGSKVYIGGIIDFHF